MSNDMLPKVPTFVKENPAAAVTVTKLITTQEDTRNKKTISSANIPEIAAAIKNRLVNNENIEQLFPDVELSIQIMVSSILSPNDMLSTKLNYTAPNIKLPSDIKTLLLKTVMDHIEEHYDIENNLYTILKESLFTKGAYVEAIVPEASLDDIINNNGQVSIESIDKYLDSLDKKVDKPISYLGDSNNIPAIGLEEFYDIKSIEGITQAESSKITEAKVILSLEDLQLDITDNPAILSANKLYVGQVEKTIFNTLHPKFSLSAEEKKEEEIIENLFKIAPTESNELIEVKTMDGASRASVGRPLVFKLPVESVIPVHIVNDVTKHIGYFVLLDNNGTPVDVNSDINTSPQAMYTLGRQTNDNKTDIISKAKNALLGITNKEPTLDNIEQIYSKIVDKIIKDKLNNGMFANLVDIKDSSDLYRVMLIRALKAQKTRLLFLPSELVSYYAFEYRDNGTGKSLLEKVAMLFSVRSILLFSKLMANVKNSITTTKVEATLDENDPDPEKSMEKIMSESVKTRLTQLPLGVTNVSELVDWAHKVGFEYKFNHPSLPEMTIDISDKSSSKIVPDTELDKSIENFIIMSFGLTPEMVENGYTADFATTVIAKNLLFAKRVMTYQNKFNPQITSNIQKILSNDNSMQYKLESIIRSNLDSIKKVIKKQTDDNETEDLRKINDDNLVKFIIKQYCTNIMVELPKPELNETNGMKETFEAYKDMLENYLDLIISTDSLPSELLGEMSDKLPLVKAILKNVLIRKWMNENNFLPEISEFMSIDAEGKPIFDVLEDYNTFVSNISDVLLGFMKKNTTWVNKLNEKISKLNPDVSDSTGSDETEVEEEQPTDEGQDELDGGTLDGATDDTLDNPPAEEEDMLGDGTTKDENQDTELDDEIEEDGLDNNLDDKENK